MSSGTYRNGLWSALRGISIRIHPSLCRTKLPLVSGTYSLGGFSEPIRRASRGSAPFSTWVLKTGGQSYGVDSIWHVSFDSPYVPILFPNLTVTNPVLVLYSFINTHMTLLVPVLSRAQMKNPTKFSGSSDNNSPIIPDDTVLLASRTALSRWRDYWLALHSQVPGDQWASMGFYKNGYNFWLVSQLLITKKESVDVVMQMEVNCEDKLEKLKVLLMDEWGYVHLLILDTYFLLISEKKKKPPQGCKH